VLLLKPAPLSARDGAASSQLWMRTDHQQHKGREAHYARQHDPAGDSIRFLEQDPGNLLTAAKTPPEDTGWIPQSLG